MTTRESPSHSPLAKILRHSRWLIAAQAITYSASLFQAMILARCLGATSYGVYVLVLAFVATINNLFNSRVWQAVVRFVPEYLEAGRKDRAISVIQLCITIEVISVLVASLVVFCCSNYATSLIPGSNVHMIFLAALAPCMTVLAEPLRAIVRIAEKHHWLTAMTAVVAAINLCMLLIVWNLGPSIESILITYLIHTALAAIGLATAATIAARGLDLSLWSKLSWSSLGSDLRRILRFIFFTNLSVSASLVNSADRLLLSLFVTPAEVGVYDLARKIVAQLDGLAAPLNRSGFQEMSVLAAAANFKKIHEVQRSLTFMLSTIVVPACLLVTLTAPVVAPLIFGVEFATTGLILQILIWQLLRLPMSWFRGYMLCINRVEIMTVASLSLAVLLPTFLLLLVPSHGILGAAWANTIWTVVWVTVMAGLFSHTKSVELSVQDANSRPPTQGTVREAA